MCALCIAVPAQMFGSAAVANLGTVAVGSHGSGSITIPLPTAPAAGTTVSLHYGTDFTVGGCAASGSTCVVAITFTPTSVGLTQDAVIVKDSSGHVLAEGFLYGKGDGPQVTFSPGSVHLIFKGAPTTYFLSVVTDQLGNVYVADSADQTIQKFAPGSSSPVIVAGQSGINGYYGDGGPATSAVLNYPGALSIDGAGNLYEKEADVVRRIDAVTGIITTVAGVYSSPGYGAPDGWPATSGSVVAGALAINANGDLYISDFSSARNGSIRKIDGRTGIITTVAGNLTNQHSGDGGPATAAGFTSIRGLAFDSSGNLYVGESAWLRRIDATTQTITTIAGDGNSNDSGDGGLAIHAEINIQGMVIDPFDNVYLNDPYGLRRIQPATGIINSVTSNGSISIYEGAAANQVPLLGSNLADLAFDRAGNYYVVGGNYLLQINLSAPAYFNSIAPQSATIGIDNVGSQALALSSGSVSGSISDQAASVAPCTFPGSLAAGASCSVVIAEGGTAAPVQGTFRVTDNALNHSNATQQASFSFGYAQVAVPASYNFGTVDAADPYATFGWTLVSSTLPYVFDHAVVVGANQADFSIFSNTFSTPSIEVVFQPQGLGVRTATLLIYGNTQNPISVALSAFVTSSLALSATNLTFAQSQWGSAKSQTIVVTNNASYYYGQAFQPATIKASGPFLIQDNCAGVGSINQGQSCTIVVDFDPAGQTGSFTGSYQLTAVASPSITFQGTAAANGSSTLSFGTTSPLTFSAIAKQSSAAVPLSVKNSGSSAATISSVVITGSQASDFHQSNDCPRSLPAGGSCVIWVNYSPSDSSPLVSTANVVVSGLVTMSQGLTGTLLTDALPRVMIEYPTAGSGNVSANFSGWAGQDGVLLKNVTILIDGLSEGAVPLSDVRSDVCTAYPRMGDCPNTGWQFSPPISLAGGSHTLTVVAGLPSGQQTHQSVQFTWPNPVTPYPPNVAIESPTQGQLVSKAINLSGWYVAGVKPFNSLSLTLDGIPYFGTVHYYARPDVCAALHIGDCSLAVGWYVSYTATAFKSVHTLTATHYYYGAFYGSQTVSFTTPTPSLPAPTIALTSPVHNQNLNGSLTISGSYNVPVSTGTGASVYNIEALIGGVDLGSIYSSTSCAQQPATSCLTANFSGTVPLTAVFSGPQTLTIRADTTGDGPYSVTVPVNVSSLVSDATDQLLLNVEAPGANAVLSGKASVSGWVVDGVTAYPEVDLTVDGVPAGSTSAQYSRPDVCAAYPWGVSCPTAGWLASIDTTTLADGSHTLTIASTSALGKRVVKTVPFVSSNNSGRAANGEFLNIESPTAGQKVSGALSVSGWAVSAASVVTEVDVFVDGLPVGTAVYNQARPDVCKAYPNSKGCPGVGWYFLLDTRTLADGAHTVKAVGVTANGSSIMTQNFTVANAGVSTKIRAVIDAPVGNATLSGDALVSGWAIDDADSISSVQINVDGFPQGFATYGGPRVDVCNVFPGRAGCPDVGWYLPIDTTQFLNGMHTLDVVVTSMYGDVETLTRVFLVGN